MYLVRKFQQNMEYKRIAIYKYYEINQTEK